jgi:hypothetical protein
LPGFLEQSGDQVQVNLEQARAADHGLTVCCVLDHAVCPVALMNDGLAATDWAVTMSVELATGLNATMGVSPDPHLRAARAAGTF